MTSDGVFGQVDGAPGRIPLGLALGEEPGAVIAAAVDAAGGLAWLREVDGEIVVASADGHSQGLGHEAGQAVVALVVARGGRARPIVAERRRLGRLPLLGSRDRWVEVDLAGTGARVERVPVRREVAIAPALIGVGAIGDAGDAGPLAFGLWLPFIGPRLALAARLGGDRAPLGADLAAAVRPRLSVLVGYMGTLLVVAATPDPIAAELTGLAIRHGAVAGPAELPRPWEDPLVQRATELGLGVPHPSYLELHPVWAGSVDSPAAQALDALADHVTDALGLHRAGPRPYNAS